VAFDRLVPLAPYTENLASRALVVIDQMTIATVGARLIDYALRCRTGI
jgi:sulfate adenylyltransferase subunit 1 (EFTu-like GTPase family)